MSVQAPRPSATVLLLRPGDDGPEVFLVRRHRKSGFMAHMWVFPGGRVEPQDLDLSTPWVRGGEAVAARFGAPGREGRGRLVSAVRETFEEADLWLGEGRIPEPVRHALARGEVSLASVLAEHEAHIDLDVLAPWARWVTPETEGRRYDAWFLVARAPEGAGRHDDHETVASGWVRAADVLADPVRRYPVAPPTWWALSELARFDTVDAVLQAAAGRTLDPVQPVLRRRGGVVDLALPGHPDHPAPRRPGLPTRIHLSVDGWVAEGHDGAS